MDDIDSTALSTATNLTALHVNDDHDRFIALTFLALSERPAEELLVASITLTRHLAYSLAKLKRAHEGQLSDDDVSEDAARVVELLGLRLALDDLED